MGRGVERGTGSDASGLTPNSWLLAAGHFEMKSALARFGLLCLAERGPRAAGTPAPLLLHDLWRVGVKHEAVVGEVASQPDHETGEDGAPDLEPDPCKNRPPRLAIRRQSLQSEPQKPNERQRKDGQ